MQAALTALRARGETIAVVLLDLHLPDAHDCVDVRTAEGRCVQLTRRQSQVLEQRVQESGIAVLFKPATGPVLLGALAALSRP